MRLRSLFGTIRRLGFAKIPKILKHPFLSVEHYHYIDLVKIIGRQNVFMLNEFNEKYLTSKIDQTSPYISMNNFNEPTYISYKNAMDMISKCDVIISSVRLDNKGKRLLEFSKSLKKFIVIVDYLDHLDIYKSNSHDKDILYRGKKLGTDFSLYLKHDIPLNFKDDDCIYPLAPMPVRQENFPDAERNFTSKENSFFYSGRIKHGVRNDRVELIKLISNHFNNLYFNFSEDAFLTMNNYIKAAINSKICVSPSGKVWDSTRHCEIGLLNSAPLIPKNNCKILGEPLLDLENCILYEVNDSFSILNNQKLIHKLNELIKEINQEKLSNIAKSWRDNVLKHHTTLARAKFLYNKILQFI